MNRTSLRNVSRRGVCVVALLSLLVTVHLGIVSSIILEDRPIIWPLHNDTIHRAGRGADFYAVYHAGMNLRHGLDPYANNEDGVTPYWYPFRYLPIVAIAAQAVTFHSPQTAYFAWVLFLEGLLVLLLVTLWRGITDTRVRLAAIGMLLINSPYFLGVYMGQFTFASVTLCFLGLLLPAGQILCCVSVLLKPVTLVALPAMARQRRYWSHGACAILCIVLLSVPYFSRHPEQWMHFMNINLRLRGGLHAGNYGFVRFLQLLMEDLNMSLVLQHWSGWIASLRVITLLATVLLTFHAKKSSIVVGVSALLLAHFLTYQHVWEHHMSAVCVPGVLLLTTRDRRKPFTAAVLFSLLLLSLPTPFGLLDSAKDPSVVDPSKDWPRYGAYLLVLSKAVPTMILYLSCVVSLCGNGLMSSWDAIRSALTRMPDRRLEDRDLSRGLTPPG